MALAESRYELLTKLAAGGMGTVYVGRLRGAAGFRRLVAIKRAHPHLLEQAAFGKMLIKEAELASSIHHPNAVAVQDVEELDGELLLVMDYVDGVPLSRLVTACDPDADDPLDPRVAVRIVLDVCAGLHACHTCTDDDDQPLGLVHRDVSPQNVLVGADGQARLTDFGIAKSLVRDDKLTQTGTVRGKTGYMAPEYAMAAELDQRSDVFAVGVVLWEALAGRRLYRGSTELETLRRLTEEDAPLLSTVAPWVGDALDEVIATALCRDPEGRFRSAEALARALEEAAQGAGKLGRHREVSDEIERRFGRELAARRKAIREGEDASPADDGPATGTMNPPLEEATDTVVSPHLGQAHAAATADGPSTLEASTLRPPSDATASARGPRWWLAAGLLVATGGVLATVVLSEATPLRLQTGMSQVGALGEVLRTAEPSSSSGPSAERSKNAQPSAEPSATVEPASPPVTPPAVVPPPTPMTKAPPKPAPPVKPKGPNGLEAKSNPYAGGDGARPNPFGP